MTACRDERGQMSLMIIGFFLLLVLLLVVVVNASGAYVAHRRVVSAADGAASAAADGIDRQAAYENGLESGKSAPLSSARARKAASRYLKASGAHVKTVTVRVSKDRVRVRLTATFRSSLSPPGWPRTSRVSADASAELRVGD